MVNFYYAYAPSLAAAVTFVALFGLTTLFHGYQLLRTRSWFWLPFLTGGVFEIVGFAARAVNATEPEHEWVFAPFVVQTLGILLAPVLFAASMYMMLGRIALLSGGEDKLLIKRKWLTKVFVCCDILSFLVQVVGGVMITQQDVNKAKKGKNIVLVGLWMQIAFFGLFVTNTILFWWRMYRHPPANARPEIIPVWRKHISVLLLACMLILARCIYRVIEYTQGKTGYIMSHEVFIYVLDAGLMMIVMLLFNFVHPSEVAAYLRGGRMARLWKIVWLEKGGALRADRKTRWAGGSVDVDDTLDHELAQQETETEGPLKYTMRGSGHSDV